MFGIENVFGIRFLTDLTTREAVEYICRVTGLNMPDPPGPLVDFDSYPRVGPEPDQANHGMREALSLMHRRLARLEGVCSFGRAW